MNPWCFSSVAIVAMALVCCAPQTAASPPVAPTSAPTVKDADVTGAWIGDYRCPQGKTGLRLTVEQHSTGVVSGTFEFFPVPENPSVPMGSFAMMGSIENRRLTLAGGSWIQRPPGYETVGLSGEISPDGDSYTGKVQNPDCGSFSLRRSH
jgi:hypothetical protein